MTIVTFLDIDGQLGQRTLKAISVDRDAEFQWSRVHASLHLPQVISWVVEIGVATCSQLPGSHWPAPELPKARPQPQTASGFWLS